MPILGSRGAATSKGFGFTSGASFLITATGGTITYDGDYAIHTFTSPGTFAVSAIKPSVPAPEQAVDYLVVAGGGASAGFSWSGGGGAGGARMSSGTLAGSYTVGPLGSGVASFPISATSYPIAVGAGASYNGTITTGSNGNPSNFSTITASGGGGSGGEGAGPGTTRSGSPGGSGGGAGGNNGPGKGGGSGNSGAFSPAEGTSGGSIPGFTNGQSYFMFSVNSVTTWEIQLENIGFGTNWIDVPPYCLSGTNSQDIYANVQNNFTGSPRSVRFVLRYCDNVLEFTLTQGVGRKTDIGLIAFNKPK
jgi:hypothetical protein